MKKLIYTLTLLACTAGIMPASAQKKVALKVSTETLGAENKTISVKKDNKGYITIFDGKSLNGWRGYGKNHVPARWTVEDGALKFWDEVVAKGTPRQKQVVKIFRDYNAMMEKAGSPYR